MGKFENGVLGMIPASDWLDLSANIDVTRPNDPIDSLFGDMKTDNIMAEWESIRSQYLLPSMAYFHGFDTEAHTAIRMPIEAHNIEKVVQLPIMPEVASLCDAGRIEDVDPAVTAEFVKLLEA